MSKLQRSVLQYYIYNQQSCIVYLKLMKTDLLLCSQEQGSDSNFRMKFKFILLKYALDLL